MKKAEQSFVCIRCPLGCMLAVESDGESVTVTGNTCPRGREYGITEVTAPTRTVTSTVMLDGGGDIKCAPVKTAAPVPKAKMKEVVDAIKRVRLTAPVAVGDVAVKDVAGTGVDVVVTRNVAAR